MRRSNHRRISELGFTIMETLVALLVFAIAIVGLVAMESRAIEAQKAAVELREAERIGQDVMADLTSRGFQQLVQRDFAFNVNPNFPYDDSGISAATRTRDLRRAPADLHSTEAVMGTVRSNYVVFRRVDKLPANGIQPVGDVTLVTGLVLEVTVLWLDYSNPAFPPPASATVTGITLNDIVPSDSNFKPYVRSVQLRTIRMNDSPVP